MNDLYPEWQTPADRYRIALDKVKLTLESPDYMEYAIGQGPLTLDMVATDALDRVVSIAEEYGWPTAEDTIIAPVHDYSDAKFLDNFFEQPSKMPVFDDSMSEEDMQAALEHQKRNGEALNNFVLYLRATPIKNLSQAAQLMTAVYGIAPVVHRANALAPDLFGALREALNSFEPAEYDYAKSFLEQPSNQDMVTAINMGYRIMGRLLKVNDQTDGVSDAHETLTA